MKNIIIVSTLVLAVNLGFFTSVFAAPTVLVFPPCGPAQGFNVVFNADGFSPGANVSWELVNTDLKPVLTGYFMTNSTGGFNEVTYADDLLPGKYNLNFFDDSNNDSKLDRNGQTFQTSISLPCR
ncbi:MAG: hypothetical protein WCB31_03530 [Nitrososphaeraceae archaeon]